MNDTFERRLETWMRDAGGFSAEDAKHVVLAMDFPARKRIGLSLPVFGRAGLAMALVTVVLGATIGLSQLQMIGGGSPLPPDPHAFAGDARMARCGVTNLDQVVYALELAHASDFATTFPAAKLAPELDRPDPAFVVVFRGHAGVGAQSGVGGAWVASPSPSPSAGTGSDVCVLVGLGEATEFNLYEDVDITGFRTPGTSLLSSPSDS